MRSPLGGNDGMNFISDHNLDGTQHLASVRGEQEIEGFRSWDQNVGGIARKPGPFGCRRISGTNRNGWRVKSTSQSLGSLSNTYQRRAQVAFDVDRQRFYRRNVQNPATLHVVWSRRKHDAIDAPQERRQGLASPGRREDEGRLATSNRRPSGNLRSSGRMKDVLKPGSYGRVEDFQR